MTGVGKVSNGLSRARVRIAAAVSVGALFLLAPSLPAQSASPISTTSPFFREVTDEAGRAVRIPQPVRRVVSLAPSLTETIYALGLQDLLVGDTDYCDYPPDAQKKTKVGGAINPSLEEIAALHPDLVLVAKGFNRLETVHALEELGISSYATDPHTVEEITTSSKKLAAVLGAPGAGDALAEDLQRRLADLHQRIGALPPKKVLFVVWTQPLISAGKHTFIADALRLAGARNIVDSDPDWPQVNLEEVARQQPDYLVFAPSHSDSTPREIEEFSSLPGWEMLDAVANHHYVMISDAVNRPAPRIVAAIEELAREIHPEAFVEKPEGGKDKLDNGATPPKPPLLSQLFFQWRSTEKNS